MAFKTKLFKKGLENTGRKGRGKEEREERGGALPIWLLGAEQTGGKQEQKKGGWLRGCRNNPVR